MSLRSKTVSYVAPSRFDAADGDAEEERYAHLLDHGLLLGFRPLVLYQEQGQAPYARILSQGHTDAPAASARSRHLLAAPEGRWSR